MAGDGNSPLRYLSSMYARLYVFPSKYTTESMRSSSHISRYVRWSMGSKLMSLSLFGGRGFGLMVVIELWVGRGEEIAMLNCEV